MAISAHTRWTLAQEARALLTRLARLRPFAMQEPMLPAAAILPRSQHAIESHLIRGRKRLRAMVVAFLRWLASPEGKTAEAHVAQRRFTIVRLRFNASLTQFDLFADVITQRSEHETGVWLAGLDIVSADALRLKGNYYEVPPLICYLDRGVGAAIRRARTRLPGGGDNPVAIVRVPRERMVGSGIASSLVHEVGHQAAALLELVTSLRPLLKGLQRGPEGRAWQMYERWISEIVADFWSVARVGIGSTMGLIGVVSLPRPFVFRMGDSDPHPMPWIRVKISAAIGKTLYPHPQWDRLARMWDSFYPTAGLAPEHLALLKLLEETIPTLVQMIALHRPRALRGKTLSEALETKAQQPAALQKTLRRWRANPAAMYRARPTLVFAAIGQGRFDGAVTPEEESVVLAKLLAHWALASTLDSTAQCSRAEACRKCAKAA